MTSALLLPLLCACLVTCATPDSDTEPAGSYLCRPAYELDDKLRGPTETYVPQPGDIMFSTDSNPVWKVLFLCAWTDHPGR